MKLPPFLTAVFFCTLFLLLPRAASSQDFSSLDRDLSALESLIQDTLENSEAQQKQLSDLQKNLAESGELIENYERIIAERESLLRDLQTRLAEMSETYRKLSLFQNLVSFEKGFGKSGPGPLFHLNPRLLFQNLTF
jgi:septal ring factor EnvC (AmiA/AmiB activator)